MRGEIWRHHKGDLYKIVGTGFDEATQKAVVVYQILTWGVGEEPALWVRALDVFLGLADVDKPRFKFEHEACPVED